MATMQSVSAIIIVAVLALVSADTCLGPTLEAKTYSTTEAQVATKTAFIIQFSLKCKNGLKDINLYANVNDKTFPATRSPGSGEYQISWSSPHDQVRSGNYEVRIFDEEGYAALRKAQRSGEDTSALKPLTVVNFEHKGVWRGPFVSSEFIAVTISLVLLYFAHNAKSNIHQ